MLAARKWVCPSTLSCSPFAALLVPQVTTEDPGVDGIIKSNASDQAYGIRVAIGGSCCDYLGCGCGGMCCCC